MDGIPLPSYKRVEAEGRFLRVDSFGRLVLDMCPDIHTHLTNPRRLDEARSTCALVLDERAFPADCVGKKGRFIIEVRFYKEESE